MTWHIYDSCQRICPCVDSGQNIDGDSEDTFVNWENDDRDSSKL